MLHTKCRTLPHGNVTLHIFGKSSFISAQEISQEWSIAPHGQYVSYRGRSSECGQLIMIMTSH